MGYPSLSCFQSFDDDDTDAIADDDADFLSSNSFDICRPSRFSFQSLDVFLDGTLFDTVVSRISFSFCLVSRSYFLCRFQSS